MRRMIRMTARVALAWALAACLPGVLAGQGLGQVRTDREAVLAHSVAEAVSLYPQDPADSLYRAARAYLNRDQYRRAAEAFARLYREYPRSSYAAQALYYQAFALYRNGAERDLRAAQAALRELQRSHADAEVAVQDAQALMQRIQGALARRGDAEAAEGVTREARAIAGAAAQACEREEDEIRMAALNALLQMDSERALPILERVLAERDEDNECLVEMRRKAVFLVAQHLDEEDLDILLDVVRNDPDPEVRSQAVFWLSQVPGARTVDALEDILRESEDPDLQKKAIFALAQTHSERTGEILRNYAMDEQADPELRAQAIFWLGQMGGVESAESLREIYASTDEPEVKERIIFSLAQAGRSENMQWLLDVAGDADEPFEMRKKALFWVGQSPHTSVEEIGALYDRMPERELREQIIFAIAQRHDAAAVDRLMDIARNEEDAELRKKAIFWLSQSDDPRVAEFLLEIIEVGR